MNLKLDLNFIYMYIISAITIQLKNSFNFEFISEYLIWEKFQITTISMNSSISPETNFK